MASAKSAQIELALFGQKIVLKHRAEDPDLVARTVALVSAKVKEAQSRTAKGSAPHQVALVALLDLAAEYLQAKARTEAYQAEIALKSAELQAVLRDEFKQEGEASK